MKKSLLALAVSLAAVHANAYWDPGVGSGQPSLPNNGELMLTIFDSDGKVSYSQDLGVLYTDLQNGSAFNGQQIHLDATALSIFGTGDLSNSSSVRWGLVAANSHTKNGTANAYTGAGFIISSAVTPPPPTASTISGGWLGLSNYQAALGMNDVAVVGNQVVSGSGSVGSDIPTGYQTFGDTYLASRAYQTYQFGSGSLDLWNYAYTNVGGTTRGVSDLGKVTLDFSNKTLTIGAVSSVPVPAAAWLMGSALAGLGTVARRRRSV